MTMPTKTNPVPAYVFCDYCWDPGMHTAEEKELCLKTRKAEEEAIKKHEESPKESSLYPHIPARFFPKFNKALNFILCRFI